MMIVLAEAHLLSHESVKLFSRTGNTNQLNYLIIQIYKNKILFKQV